VANNKGAIAFVKASLLTDEIRSRVKLVTSISE
jgi:hypothetical protein